MHTVYALLFPLAEHREQLYIGIARDVDVRYGWHREHAMRGTHGALYKAWRKYGDPEQTKISTHGTELEALEQEFLTIWREDNWCPNGLNNGAFYLMTHPTYGCLERLAGKFARCSQCNNHLPQALIKDGTCKYCSHDR